MFWRNDAGNLHWLPFAIENCSQLYCVHDAVATSEWSSESLRVSGSHILNGFPVRREIEFKVKANMFIFQSG